MDTLAPARRSWLAPSPVLGRPVHWMRGGASYGALVAGSYTAIGMVAVVRSSGVSLLSPHIAMTVFGFIFAAVMGAGSFGAAWGALQPGIMDRLRGRVPLPLLVAAQTVVGAGLGAATFLVTLLAVVGVPHVSLWSGNLLVAAASGAVGAWAALLWWLPFTFATVTGRRTGWVTLVAAACVPAALPVLLQLTWLL